MSKQPAPRDAYRDAIADMVSDLAKCQIVFFVLPPALTLTAMCLVEMVR